MTEQGIINLIRQAPLSFVGTVEQLAAATMAEVPIDGRTAVVRVDHVLHAPAAFQTLQGQSITVQLSPDVAPPAIGASEAFFTQGLAFGDSVAVTELGRLPVDQVEPHITQGVVAGKGSFEALQREAAAAELRDHAAGADAVVIGRVLRLEKAAQSSGSEHDPDWWAATVDVAHTETGDATGEVRVLYANSIDVRWRRSPKPKASQAGLWLLHRTTGALAEIAPYQMVHEQDFRPEQELATLRGNGE